MRLSVRLRQIFARDAHANAAGVYTIRSLYFDGPSDRALREKIDGVDAREKFRIRFYNDDHSFIRLEKKIKRRGLVSKYSASLSRAQVERILAEDYGFLLEGSQPLLIEFYAKLRGQLLRPTVTVEYEREAFVFRPGNVRITCDRHVRRERNPARFFEHGPQATTLDISDGFTVLEVKYDEWLPDLVRLVLRDVNRMVSANSKYAQGRRFD